MKQATFASGSTSEEMAERTIFSTPDTSSMPDTIPSSDTSPLPDTIPSSDTSSMPDTLTSPESAEFQSVAGARTLLLLGQEGVEQLKKSHIMVVGCGAVGGMAIEALARTGVGKITVVDFDCFSPSNLNRQILATIPTMGIAKTEVACQRIAQINPTITVIQKQLCVNANTIDSLFNESPDFVIDAIDSLNPKTTLIEALINRRIPFISAMGAALKTDLTRIKIAPMKKTIQCPLASFVRKRLRRRGIDLSFPVVYSDECVSDKTHLGAPDGESNRHTMGSIITVTGIFGLMCAHFAIQHIINQSSLQDNAQDKTQ